VSHPDHSGICSLPLVYHTQSFILQSVRLLRYQALSIEKMIDCRSPWMTDSRRHPPTRYRSQREMSSRILLLIISYIGILSAPGKPWEVVRQAKFGSSTIITPVQARKHSTRPRLCWTNDFSAIAMALDTSCVASSLIMLNGGRRAFFRV